MAAALRMPPFVPAAAAARSLVARSAARWRAPFGRAAAPRRFQLPSSRPRVPPPRPFYNFASRDAKIQAPEDQSEIIFIGTGTSEGIPRVSCLTNQSKTCKVCSKAIEPGNKNRRLNTSILIRYVNSVGRFNILVDAGKFFYHSALRWFPAYGLRNIDAVIITHSHADAIGGLDDLRDWTNNVQPFIPIYVAQRDFEVMKKTHYYIVDTSVIVPGAAVSELQFNVINEEPFVIHDLKVTPLPVWHGHGYRSLGFRFGDVCYISDVSDIPEETYMLLKDCDLLILDALRPDRSSSTHFGLPRALEEVRKIQPRRTLFTGMMHLMDHDEINEELAKLLESEGLDVQLSYDGLRVPPKRFSSNGGLLSVSARCHVTLQRLFQTSLGCLSSQHIMVEKDLKCGFWYSNCLDY
ncbi:putative hydrolase C777.06c isoform X1 [Musa acuminata AAA Group]|uniref:putative hydrolase C777.06c isoform X1 n=1 Tax=Musa acuminata AAA Group TaxID=214697 RepID=UPI0031E3658D